MDEALFREEAERLRPAMKQVARLYLDDYEADDVVQDALLRLWQMHSQLPVPLDRLAAVIVRNMAIDHLRRRHATVSVDSVEIAELTAGDDTRYERIEKLMASLPPIQQTVLRLRHISEMDYDEIATLVGSTPQAVCQMVSRARRTLLKNYNKQ